jgi:hypothetical protein
VQDNHFIGGQPAISVLTSANNARILGNVVKTSSWFALHLNGERAVVTGNVIEGCRAGCNAAVLANGANTLIADNHVANNDAGIIVGNANVTVRRNVLASHAGTAVIVGGLFQETEPNGAVITSNNFGDNGTVADPALGSNCAVINRAVSDVSAARNYWGSALGPGADPADRACTAGSVVVTAPHLTRAVVIVNAAGQ